MHGALPGGQMEVNSRTTIAYTRNTIWKTYEGQDDRKCVEAGAPPDDRFRCGTHCNNYFCLPRFATYRKSVVAARRGRACTCDVADLLRDEGDVAMCTYCGKWWTLPLFA